jgi:hypothetical protein
MNGDPSLKRAVGARGAIRAVEPAGGEARTDGSRPLETIRCTYRPPDADFYCWKFGVWYNLMDCCDRHYDRTYEGCVDCGQGRNNLRQNRTTYAERRAQDRLRGRPGTDPRD